MNARIDVLDRLIVITALFGLSMHFWGSAMNALVIVANNGSMPVWPMPLTEVSSGAGWFDATNQTVNLSLLGDWMWLGLPDVWVRWELLQEAIESWAGIVNYPLKRGIYAASIGDMLFWSGSLLFLLVIPPLLTRIPFRLAQDGIRFQR